MITIPPNDVSMDDMKIRFDGARQIDANTLINNLLCLSNVIQEVNRELHTDRKIDVKIKALKEGSFLVHIVIESNLLESIGNLFTGNNLGIAANIVTVVGGIYAAAKFLGGKDSEVIEQNDTSTKIKNIKGDVTYIDNRVINIYQNNKVVRDELSKEFESLQNDPAITGFELLDRDDKPLVNIPKESFSEISGISDNAIAADERIITKVGILSIASLSFERNIKWGFYFEGNKITAKIKDDEFVKLIDSGEKFAKGDSLEAEVEIKQQYDQSVKAYVNKSYMVSKIIRHNPRPEQGTIGLGD